MLTVNRKGWATHRKHPLLALFDLIAFSRCYNLLVCKKLIILEVSPFKKKEERKYICFKEPASGATEELIMNAASRVCSSLV